MIARDTIDGTEVWKMIAFMLLDAIVQLSGLEKRHVVLSALTHHGPGATGSVLSNFVRIMQFQSVEGKTLHSKH
jgi:nuclear pore complex protein Nup205